MRPLSISPDEHRLPGPVPAHPRAQATSACCIPPQPPRSPKARQLEKSARDKQQDRTAPQATKRCPALALSPSAYGALRPKRRDGPMGVRGGVCCIAFIPPSDTVPYPSAFLDLCFFSSFPRLLKKTRWNGHQRQLAEAHYSSY